MALINIQAKGLKGSFIIFITAFCLLSCYRNNKSIDHTVTKKLNVNDIVFIDQYLDTANINDLINNNKSNIIFRIPRFSCSSCINREIETLKEYLNKDKEKKYFIVTDYFKIRDFVVFREYSHIKGLNFLNCNAQFTKLDTAQIPYYVLLDNNLIIKDILLVDKQNHQKSIQFLNHYHNK